MKQCFLRIAARKANFSYNETLVLRGSTVQYKFLTVLSLGGGAESAHAVKMLCATQQLLTRIFSNFMTFPNFYSSKSWCNSKKIALVILKLLIVF